MAEIGSASLGIIPSFDGFERRLSSGTSGPMSAAGRAGGESFGRSFNSRVKSAVKIGAAGLAVAAAGAFKFAGDSLEEARDAQKVGAQTRAVIKSTGGAARVTERGVGKLAERLSDMAGIDDELIQAGSNVLLTFTKIRNEAGKGNKVFDDAATAALNMSVALDQDLKSASIQVGKALNDPVKGVTSLGRAGVQFTEDQKATIKALVEQGDTLSAQKIVLKELDKQFAGSAKAQATEGDKLVVAWGNLKEEIGTELIPVMDDLAVFLRKKGIPAARDFFGWVKDEGIPALKDFKEQVDPVAEKVGEFVGFLNDLPKSVKIGGLAGIAAIIGGSKLRGGATGGGGALGTAGKVLGIAKPVPVFVTNPGFGGGDGPGGGGGKKGLVKKAMPFAAALGPAGAALFGSELLLDYAEKNYPKRQRRDDEEHARRLADSFHAAGDQAAALNNKANTLRDHLTVITNGATIPFKSPGLDDVLTRTRTYEGILEGIPREVRTTFIQSVQRNNVIEPGDGRGGKTPAGVSVNIYGDVRPADSREFYRDVQRRSRSRAGGGR